MGFTEINQKAINILLIHVVDQNYLLDMHLVKVDLGSHLLLPKMKLSENLVLCFNFGRNVEKNKVVTRKI